MFRPHRRRLQRDADEGRNRRGRPDERNRGVLPQKLRRAEPPVPAPAEAPRARAQCPDTSNDGEVDVDECTARRLTSHRRDACSTAWRCGSSPRTPGSLFDVRTGRRRSTAASRSACSSCPRSARAGARRGGRGREFSAEFLSMARQVFQMIDKDNSGTLVKAEMSARSVRPSTRARRGSHAIDATRCLPRDPPAASRP